MKLIKNIFAALILAVSLHVSAFAAQPLDINTATATELADQLNGVGKVKAEAIVTYRDAHGKFESVDQLTNVKGIGLATVEKNRDVMTVSSTSNN